MPLSVDRRTMGGAAKLRNSPCAWQLAPLRRSGIEKGAAQDTRRWVSFAA